MKKRVFHCYFDPGHGWLKAKTDPLRKLGVAGKITRCSRVRNGFAYLEEDRDAGTLISALRERGTEAILRRHYSDKLSRIRSYGLYDPAGEPGASAFP